ncbi:MAG: hypothetical protein ACUVXB_17755 [Bryobacteraceae bacterium]
MNLRDLVTDPAEVRRVAADALAARPGASSKTSCTARPPGLVVTKVEPYVFPKDGDLRFTERVSPSAVVKLDAIRDQALALGWSERRLYQNRGQFRFPWGEDHGLACFIGEPQRIGEVTQHYIEIIGPPPGENRLRFYNPDAPHPWRVACLSPSVSGRGLSPMTEKSK